MEAFFIALTFGLIPIIGSFAYYALKLLGCVLLDLFFPEEKQ